MATAKTDADWLTIDANSLPPIIKDKYDAYKQAYHAMKAARQDFEATMTEAASLAKGKRMIFGYNFGKLSIAVVADDRKPAKPKNNVLSLAVFLDKQSAAGYAV